MEDDLYSLLLKDKYPSKLLYGVVVKKMYFEG